MMGPKWQLADPEFQRIYRKVRDRMRKRADLPHEYVRGMPTAVLYAIEEAVALGIVAPVRR